MTLTPMNFILIPLILLLIVIVIRFIIPMIRIRISGLLTWRRSFMLSSLYLGILLLLVPVLYSLPDKDFIKLIDTKDQAVVQSQKVINGLFNDLHISLNMQQGLYGLTSQTFKVDTKKVLFMIDLDLANQSGDYQFFVERKEIDDEVIEVSTYMAAELVEGIDLSKLSLPLKVSFQNGMLSFMSAGQKKFDLKQFNPDFTMNQFKKYNLENVNGRSSSGLSGQIIYIRIPKSLEIDKGKYNDQIQMLSQ